MSLKTAIAITALTVVLLGASPAAAHVIAQSDLRSPVPPGAMDRIGSVTVINEDPIPEDPSEPGPPPFTVCNLGDCGASQGITLVPSCAAQAPDEHCIAIDPGVFSIGSTGTGTTSGCPGTPFTIAEISPGRFTINPATPGRHVVLSPQFRCRIEFAYDVLKTPATDAMPGVDGVQTTQVTEVFSAQDLDAGTPAFDRGSDSVTFAVPPLAPTRPSTPASPPAADTTAPVLGGLSLSRTRFTPAASGRAIAAAASVGTRVRYSISERAVLSFRVERIRAGRRVGGRCVRPVAANRGARRCRRYVGVKGGFTDEGSPGANSFRFRGRLRGRRLAPGLYRLSAVASDLAGNASTHARARFRILTR